MGQYVGMPDAETIGRRISRLLKQRGISQRKLEILAELSPGYASRLVRGQRNDIRTETLVQIAKVLRVHPMYLATGEGPSDIDVQCELHHVSSAPFVERIHQRYPERDRAVDGARAMGYCEQAIARVLAYTYPDGVDATCITRDEWFDMIRDADKNIADKRSKYGGGAEFDVAAPLRRVSEKHAVGE